MNNYTLKYSIYIFDEEGILYDLVHSKFGIKIIMHMKEKGHKEPHVHIKYENKEAVLSMEDLWKAIYILTKESMLKNGYWTIKTSF